MLSCSSTITDIHDDRIETQLRAAIYVDVPYVPQSSAEDCGAAALSSVGQYWDFDMTPAAILRKYPLQPDAPGYSMGELKRIAQKEGLTAFVIPGQFSLIEEQIRSGRPLIVPLQLDTIPAVVQPFDHYVIIVGMSKARSTVILMDPQKGLISLKRLDFMKAWSAKEKAILLVAPPVK
jgi:ABC-type bacteriocin/lantibiotic exporter with double-glycine peptidase domain